jgi:hypothetical protein
MTNLEEVEGFEECSGATSVAFMFTSCTNLRSIYADSFDRSAITSYTAFLYGCNRLVGGTGFVPTYSASATGAAMMRIDTAGLAGYLTAGS